MIYLISILLSGFIFLISTREAHAIIVVVPAVLIPIVSIMVWIVVTVTTPIVALSALYFKIKKRSVLFGIFIGIALVLLFGVLLTIGFKLIDPNRPLY